MKNIEIRLTVEFRYAIILVKYRKSIIENRLAP